MNLDKVDKFKGWHKFGCVRINPNNSLNHEVHKLVFAYGRMKEGHRIGTEVVLDNGRIVDLVDFTTGEFIEFETGKSYDKDDDATTVRI